MAGRCRVYVLGEFRVEVEGRPVHGDAWRHRRGAELIKLLALSPAHRLHREQIVDALWPDLPADAGNANLRKAIHYARRALGREDGVATEGGMVRLWPAGRLAVDADEFEAAAAEATRRGDPEAAVRAASRYAGDVLPEDPYVPWTTGPRDRLRHRYLETLRLAGRWDRLVELDPLDEQAHRELMRAHLASGNRQAAMRRFEILRTLLHEELGVGPDPATVALYEEVLAMEGSEPATPAERAQSHLAAGLVALNRMDLTLAEREARIAREIAVEAGLEQVLGQASGLLGMVAHGRGAWRTLFKDEFRQTIRDAPAFASSVFEAHLCLAEFSLYGSETPDDISAFARELLELADRHDSLQGKAVATLMLGEAELLAGRLEAAEADLSRAGELHGTAGATSGRALCLVRLAETAVLGGDRPRATELLTEAHDAVLGSSLESHLLVRVHGARIQSESNPEAATLALDASLDEMKGKEVCEPCSMGLLIAAAIAEARAARPDDARRHLDHAERVAGMWQGGPWLASVWEARAEVRLAEGEPAQAAALFREASDLFRRAGHLLSAARCAAASESAETIPAGRRH